MINFNCSSQCVNVCVFVTEFASHHAFHLQETPADEAVVGTSKDCSVLLLFVVALHQITPYISSTGDTCKGSSGWNSRGLICGCFEMNWSTSHHACNLQEPLAPTDTSKDGSVLVCSGCSVCLRWTFFTSHLQETFAFAIPTVSFAGGQRKQSFWFPGLLCSYHGWSAISKALCLLSRRTPQLQWKSLLCHQLPKSQWRSSAYFIKFQTTCMILVQSLIQSDCWCKTLIYGKRTIA